LKEVRFVTQNRAKVLELKEKAKPFGVEIIQVDAAYPELQADTLEQVVKFGLTYCSRNFAAPLIIEDSGLFVDALNGFPGPFSSYVYRTIGNRGLVKIVGEGVPARFESLIGCYYHDCKLFRGQVEGSIVSARGSRGFGFDPIFEYEGRTFGELTLEEKNVVSHRGRATQLFLRWASTDI
jgi:XTP/dITP diphosphohydrolase